MRLSKLKGSLRGSLKGSIRIYKGLGFRGSWDLVSGVISKPTRVNNY